MWFPLAVLATFTILLSWMRARPGAALALCAALKRRWRAHLIQRLGATEFERLAAELRRRGARNNIDPDLIESALAERKPDIVRQLGQRAAERRLGPPTLCG